MKLKIAVSVSMFVAGLACAHWLFPDKVVEKEKIVTQYKIRTIERTVKKSDGTIEIIKETTDNSVIAAEANRTINLQPNWLIGASAGIEWEDTKPIYGVQVQRRILGPMFAGVYARTDSEIGILVTLEL